jgi:large subunit ribosomal protein L36e
MSEKEKKAEKKQEKKEAKVEKKPEAKKEEKKGEKAKGDAKGGKKEAKETPKAAPATAEKKTPAKPAKVKPAKKTAAEKKELKIKHVLAVGLHRGHKVTKRKLPTRPSRTKGVVGKRRRFIKTVIREVVGYAPYERRIMELLRNGLDKRALKLAKKKLGGHHRGLRKRAELTDALKKIKQRQQAEREQAEQQKK